MNRVETLIHNYNNHPVQYIGEDKCGMALSSKIIENQSAQPVFNAPNDVLEWWKYVVSAALFEDITFGQWGLCIFSQQDAYHITAKYQNERPGVFLKTDLVLGHFLGDSDLLFVSCSPKDYGQIFVALPIDARKDWYKVADSFLSFLELFYKNKGDKFWTRQVFGEKIV
jgi:hypothetical protein